MTEAFYRSTSGWLTNVLRRIGGGEATDDIVQETFIRFREAALGEVENPEAMLVRIARNLLRDEWRKSSRRAQPAYRAALDVREGTALTGAQYEAVLLRDIIRSLPPPLREVFVLHRFGGNSYAEIAVLCGISVKSVERRMTEALKLCAERLRD